MSHFIKERGREMDKICTFYNGFIGIRFFSGNNDVVIIDLDTDEELNHLNFPELSNKFIDAAGGIYNWTLFTVEDFIKKANEEKSTHDCSSCHEHPIELDNSIILYNEKEKNGLYLCILGWCTGDQANLFAEYYEECDKNPKLVMREYFPLPTSMSYTYEYFDVPMVYKPMNKREANILAKLKK